LFVSKITKLNLKFLFDSSILNTMKNEIISALEILKGTGVSIIDAARFVRNILDSKTSDFKLSDVQYCSKVVQVGVKNIRTKEMSFESGFELYYESKKQYLRPDSLRDIRTIGKRLIRFNSKFAKLNFSELTRSECEDWLVLSFHTPSQFNKARAMLHALFQFALRREWCDKNPIKFIERKKIIEKEIKPLTLEEVKHLLRNAKFQNCLAVVGLMMYAGIRPREAKRLEWNDIDLEDNSIRVRSQCSKTGGVRHVEICPNLKNILMNSNKETQRICPKNWNTKWQIIRNRTGFKGCWVQDILRHTYASFHAKYYKDLSRLQLNMGHHDISLLRSRYVNMSGISFCSAKQFFGSF